MNELRPGDRVSLTIPPAASSGFNSAWDGFECVVLPDPDGREAKYWLRPLSPRPDLHDNSNFYWRRDCVHPILPCDLSSADAIETWLAS